MFTHFLKENRKKVDLRTEPNRALETPLSSGHLLPSPSDANPFSTLAIPNLKRSNSKFSDTPSHAAVPQSEGSSVVIHPTRRTILGPPPSHSHPSKPHPAASLQIPLSHASNNSSSLNSTYTSTLNISSTFKSTNHSKSEMSNVDLYRSMARPSFPPSKRGVTLSQISQKDPISPTRPKSQSQEMPKKAETSILQDKTAVQIMPRYQRFVVLETFVERINGDTKSSFEEQLVTSLFPVSFPLCPNHT